MDQALETRLRTDPTGDPRHAPGQFRDRVVRTAAARARPLPTTLAARPVDALLVVAVLLAGAVIFRAAITGPGTTPSPVPPSPTPSASPRASFASEAVGAAVEQWLARYGGDQPSVSVTFAGPGGEGSWTNGDDPGAPVGAAARIGEISRVYIAAAIAMIDDCSRVAAAFSCRKGIYPTTMRLDDPVGRWYPDWPAADATTVRQLLEGSSGLAPVAGDLADLTNQIAAAPAADWTRQTVLARAIAAPRRFEAGARSEPVDTEWLMLEAIVERATSQSSSLVIPTEAYALPFNTTLVDQPPVGLLPGSRPNGAAVAELAPAVLALVGNSGGIAAPSADIADYANSVWLSTETLNPAIVDLLTDAAHGHASPLGAVGLCPCDGDTRLVIAQYGRAVGWSSIIAFDFADDAGIGVVLGREIPADDLQALLQALLPISPP